MTQYLSSETRDGVTSVTLNRPQVHNAFDAQLIQELTDEANRLSKDNHTRVVVLRSEGKSFCAGADLNWMKSMADYSIEENIADSQILAGVFEAWDNLPKPVVGRIQGAALGGGTGLTAVCDIAVAAEPAVFGFTEVRLGLLPAVISPFVLAKIGVGAARELFLTGERFSAQIALKIGLVNRVVAPDALDSAVDACVEKLLKGGPAAHGRIKQLLRDLAESNPGEVRKTTTRAIAEARASSEGVEGMEAFLSRRKPSWMKEV